MLGLMFSNIWQKMSTDFLDAAMRFQFLRSWALKQGEKQLYNTFVLQNREELPKKVQELRTRALTNLLYTVDKAITDGRISSQIRRGLINSFVNNVIVGEKDRMAPFREKYGFEPPTFLTISPTKKCNLNCKGCYAGSTAKNENVIPFSVFDRIIKEKRDEWGSHFTVISGGEPLMYKSEGKDLFGVLESNPDNYFMMYTNGTLIDDAVAERMAQLGNITPAISVEGWEKETDDRRGKGVYNRIQKAFDSLKKYGVPFGVSITATRENAETILSDEYLDHCFNDRGAIYGWIFQYMPIGRSYTVDLMVTPEQRKWMLEKELEMIYEKNLFLVDFWNGGPMSVGCISAGRSGGYFYVDWDSNAAPCVFYPYYVANIEEIYKNGGTITDVLMTDYFKSIRSWQKDYLRKGKETGNLFTPCPIRDHHRQAFDIIQKYNTSPMDENAKQALTDNEYHRKMEDYNKKVDSLLDPMWKEKILSE